MRVRLDLQQFVASWANDPFTAVPHCWGTWTLTRKDIERTRISKATPFDPILNDVRGDRPWSRRHHLHRIRFLVDNPSLDPVEIAIDEAQVSLSDGFHRVAAALFRGDEWIDGEIEEHGDGEAPFCALDLLVLALVAWHPPEDEGL